VVCGLKVQLGLLEIVKDDGDHGVLVKASLGDNADDVRVVADKRAETGLSVKEDLDRFIVGETGSLDGERVSTSNETGGWEEAGQGRTENKRVCDSGVDVRVAIKDDIEDGGEWEARDL